MIQEIAPRIFNNQYYDREPQDMDYVLAFTGTARNNDRVLVGMETNGISLPRVKDLKLLKDNLRFLFLIDEESYFLFESECEPIDKTKNFSYELIKCLRINKPVHTCFAGMTGYHLYCWYRDNRFCGRCGSTCEHDKSERMMRCPKCGNMIFPKIAPAVIIGVKNGESILISTYAGREYKGRALLAGFCEIGETPEETVRREVYEEVGLKVKNIRYYGSQPWGFDSNLLLGYFCEVDGEAEIKRDESELATAEFIRREDISEDKNLLSLTATMIEEFRNNRV